ncbi:hypothetical protein ASG90_07745 [Nocardioides sp. Soil797]|nr:hypothetical protein ASG90_07745 [Nocardioides sp. Soil797]
MNNLLRQMCDDNGVFLRREALGMGLDQKTITRLARDGTFHRVRHGAYTFGDIWRVSTPEQRHRITARAVLRTARSEALLSHVSAALEYAVPIWGMPLDEVHTTRRDGHAGRREAGIRHHQGLLVPGDLHELDGIPLTSATRTAVDLTTVADAEHALVPINAMLHQGLMTVEAFLTRLEKAEHWPDTLSAHVVKRLLNPKCESPGESRTDYICWASGLPRPEAQVEIRDDQGRLVARVDFAWPDRGVFLEFDGRVKYQKLLRPGEDPTDVVIREKRREERVCEVTGWRCIRITWSDLADPDRLAARIRAMWRDGPQFAA